LATAMLAIAVGSLVTALNRCLAAARAIEYYTTAENLLANKMAEFRDERANDYLDQEGTFEEQPNFRWERKFESTEFEGLWKQTITVFWKERGRVASDSVVDYRYLPRKQS
jgi:hypothetical protein